MCNIDPMLSVSNSSQLSQELLMYNLRILNVFLSFFSSVLSLSGGLFSMQENAMNIKPVA